ncbi:MAG: DNA recombination protein RmuC [Pseudomonadales bacterium]
MTFSDLTSGHWQLLALAGLLCGIALASASGWRLRQRLRAVQADYGRCSDRLEWLQSEYDVAADAAVIRQNELLRLHGDNAALSAQLEAQQQHHAAQLQQLKNEFAVLSRDALNEQGSAQSERLGGLLRPLQSQLQEFRSRIDQVHQHTSSERASLRAEVAQLKAASERMGRETITLAQALKGDQALKGHWGEVVLESLLEGAGLRPGIEFDTQANCRTIDGDQRRPDVIVHLPGRRDVVIDAKVSLGDYQLLSRDGDRKHQKRHAEKLRAHVRALAQRDYDRLEAVQSLDLVLMFVPMDAALGAALEVAPKLLDESLAKGIAIVSPNSLMLVLRLMRSLWQHQAQQDNAREIAQQAAGLHDQFATLLAELDALGRQLVGAEGAARQIRNRLGEGPSSVLRRVDRLRELGAPARTALVAESLPDKVRTTSETEVS